MLSRRSLLACAVALLACSSTPLLTSATIAHTTSSTPNSVVLYQDGSMIVDGASFKIKGIAYSPVPSGESVNFLPHGDYFTPDYLYLWARDLPLLRAMGVNTLRIYSWDNTVDHTVFLDAVQSFGLKVVVTHYVGNSKETPVATSSDRANAITEFTKHVSMLGDHPAILSWSFGNELNGAWLGFMDEFSTQGNCKWSSADCYNNEDGVDSACFKAQECAYKGLFGWINDAVKAAKLVTTRPITSTFADVDHLINNKLTLDKIPRFDTVMKDLDYYAIQIYRGKTMSGYLQTYATETTKPLLVGEYGVDSFNDVCGWQENFDSDQPCKNTYIDANKPGTKGGSTSRADFIGCTNAFHECKLPGEETQKEWDVLLANEIASASHVLGGILMEWNDQNWKNVGTQDFCKTPCPAGKEKECADPTTTLGKKYAIGGSAECTYKAHITCANYDSSAHDLCGYYLQSAPDNYVNEAWFGLNSVTDCGTSHASGSHHLSSISKRPVIDAMRSVFGGKGGATEATCAGLLPCWQCSVYSTQDEVANGACNLQCGMTLGSGKVPPTSGSGGSGNGNGSGSGTGTTPTTNTPGGITQENPAQGNNDGLAGRINSATNSVATSVAQFVTLVVALWSIRF